MRLVCLLFCGLLLLIFWGATTVTAQIDPRLLMAIVQNNTQAAGCHRKES